MFGADDETEQQELAKALANGENAEEIAKLQSESNEMKHVRDTLHEPGAAQRVFEKVFTTDVQRLLQRETMWKSRAPPTPLHWDEARTSDATDKAATGTQAGLKDHQQLTLAQTVQLFESR